MITYIIIPSESLVYTRYQGVVTYDQRVDHIYELSRDINYQAPMKNLIDMRSCQQYNLSADEEEKFAQNKTSLSGRFAGEQCAICVRCNLQYGMSRMHQVYMSGSSIETMIFRTFEESLEWLGLQPQNLEFHD